MSLAAIAVVSRRSDEPLYLRSFIESKNLLFGQYGQKDCADADFFGDIRFDDGLNNQDWKCECKYEFMLNAASSQLGQILAEGKWKKQGSFGADACWVGFLCSMDCFNAYGYVTTNTTYLAIVEDAISPDNVQLQQSRDNELKKMLSYVHRSYTESLLNPFADVDSRIISKRFISSVERLVTGFNDQS